MHWLEKRRRRPVANNRRRSKPRYKRSEELPTHVGRLGSVAGIPERFQGPKAGAKLRKASRCPPTTNMPGTEEALERKNRLEEEFEGERALSLRFDKV